MLHTAYHGHENPDRFAPGNDDSNAYGALVAMAMSFARFIRDIKPKYLAIALDYGRANFRNDIFADYKSHRKENPASLTSQLKQSKAMLQTLGCRCFSEKGFEADDLMASLGVWARQRGLNVCHVSVDKDMLQLLDVGVHVMHPQSRVLTGPDDVFEKYGVWPETLCDLQALMGDSCDNIPGVRGVGLKTATMLLTHFDSVDRLYRLVDSGAVAQVASELTEALGISPARAATIARLLKGASREEVLMFRQIVTLRKDITLSDMSDGGGGGLSTAHFRYLGEPDTTAGDALLTMFGPAFIRPLTLLRQQYPTLEAI